MNCDFLSLCVTCVCIFNVSLLDYDKHFISRKIHAFLETCYVDHIAKNCPYFENIVLQKEIQLLFYWNLFQSWLTQFWSFWQICQYFTGNTTIIKSLYDKFISLQSNDVNVKLAISEQLPGKLSNNNSSYQYLRRVV